MLSKPPKCNSLAKQLKLAVLILNSACLPDGKLLSRQVVLDLNGEILEGSLKSSKMKLVQAWIEIHKEELIANWKLLSEGEGFFQIEPLR